MTTRYLRIHPIPIHLPNAGYVGYGAPIAAAHSSAPNVGEYNGWVALAKSALLDLGIGDITDTTDILDDDFTFAINQFQEEYGDLYELEATGYLDPKTTGALIDVYEQVYETVPPLVPVYYDEEGVLIVGYPKKKGMSTGMKWGLGLGAAALIVGVAVVATR